MKCVGALTLAMANALNILSYPKRKCCQYCDNGAQLPGFEDSNRLTDARTATPSPLQFSCRLEDVSVTKKSHQAIREWLTR